MANDGSASQFNLVANIKIEINNKTKYTKEALALREQEIFFMVN